MIGYIGVYFQQWKLQSELLARLSYLYFSFSTVFLNFINLVIWVLLKHINPLTPWAPMTKIGYYQASAILTSDVLSIRPIKEKGRSLSASQVLDKVIKKIIKHDSR